MQQRDLFDYGLAEPLASPKPAARTTDPASSHVAAEQVHNSGAAARQRERVIDLVYMHPGKTSKELAALSDLDRYQIARRLPEAEKAGVVRREAKGRNECRWYPV